MCVQKFDDSRGPAIRITYRISLRSSSLWEPRHPLLKVVYIHIFLGKADSDNHEGSTINTHAFRIQVICYSLVLGQANLGTCVLRSTLVWGYYVKLVTDFQARQDTMIPRKTRMYCYFTGEEILDRCGNDPSAGSPTETLLRLHLPLNDKV